VIESDRSGLLGEEREREKQYEDKSFHEKRVAESGKSSPRMNMDDTDFHGFISAWPLRRTTKKSHTHF
jgi:hypothetical protein